MAELQADGVLRREVVAEGFEDPVLGMAMLWATANNFLYQFTLPPTGPATDRRLLVEDKNKAWNPFGMFVLEWEPDGMLCMSVGDHQVKLVGPDNTLESRGKPGVIVRMTPDGTDIELLTQGFRVPYSFEIDPFGQLWLLSNGAGNPNRSARIIEAVDYHCFTRNVDGQWLAGLVRDEGESLRVITADDEKTVRKGDIEDRTVMKLSLMREGQERLMSTAELVDLVEYLISLR